MPIVSDAAIALVSDSRQARAALTPIRRRLLEALRTPGSAASLAATLDMPRQKLAYHVRALEAAGLVRLVEERQRRGCVERIVVACADAFVLDPSLVGAPRPAEVDAQDRFASDHLVRTAAEVVREVARMRKAADDEGKRLLTLTLEADLGFSSPADFDRFTAALTEAVAEIARSFAPRRGARRYRLLAAAHPAVANKPTTPTQ
ncbi:MAG: helix-turn-helix transcriptional regulator [Deltaproteobacteria bacterium]|nr:helix-turn-helix transcriptional regulator [Deltaproteobacteria bacterium]